MYAARSTKQTLAQLKVSNDGLDAAEAKTRLEKYGPNEIQDAHQKSLWQKIIEPFASIYIAILLIGAVISVITGHPGDAIIIVIVVVVNALIEYAQSYSADRVLKALKDFDARYVKVRRKGKTQRIDTREVVPGDIVMLEEGQAVPADGRLLEISELSIDESSLTGESLPINKTTKAVKDGTPVYEQTSMVFKGSLVQAGRGVYVVTNTGNNTEFGKIAQLAIGETERAPIAKKIDKLTTYLVIGTLAATVLVIGLGVLRGSELLEMLRFGVALAVSVIPEGLPVTLTIVFLLGIQRMAKHKAFVRKLPAVETLGMITAIATDKTGTLTHNQLEIKETWDLDGSLDASEHSDLWKSVSHQHPDLHHAIEERITTLTEPFAKQKDWIEADDLPFDTARRFTVVMWRYKKDDTYHVFIKGAPEAILSTVKLNKKHDDLVNDTLKRMTNNGMRVIAVAKKELKSKPKDLNELKYSGFVFTGFIGFQDAVRKETKSAIAQTRKAGIDVYMLTGDHTNTARVIGKEVGIIDGGGALAGSAIADMAPQTLKETLKETKVYGRVLPEHKYKILEELRTDHIAAMTGDGVNDAPALAKADVGIAMGSGTDVAKEAADVVLLDDNYSTIVRAIRQGRTIYSNIRKMVFYLLSSNLAEAATIVLGLLLGWPLPLSAAQVLWLNLVTDTTMVIPIGLEPEEPGVMDRPPRKPTESLLSRGLMSRLVITTAAMALSSLWVYWMFLDTSTEKAQTMAFLSLVVVQWAAAFGARSETRSIFEDFTRPNYKLFGGIFLGVLLNLIVIVGPLQDYMGTTTVSASSLLYLIPPIIVTILSSELHKLVRKMPR